MSGFPQTHLLIFIGLLIGLAGSTVSAAGYAVNPNYDDGISYETLKAKIESNGIQTLEGALALIPPPVFANHVLVYRSRSLQQSSPRSPRAIVFGQSGKFIFAFNGNPKHRGYNSLEMVQFRESTNRFEFREITFDPGHAPAYSPPNPKKCMECHQSASRADVDMRPNWEPYNFWPGVYGSMDEDLSPVLRKKYDAHLTDDKPLYHPLDAFHEQDLFLIDEQAGEATNLEKFRTEVKPTDKRYSFLPDYSLRNPLSLTKIAITLNFRRIVRLMHDELGPLYDVYKYAIAGLARMDELKSSAYQHRCGELYFPETAMAMHLKAVQALRPIVASDLVKEKSYSRSPVPLAKGFEFVFEPLGIDTSDWSTEFKTGGRFAFDKDRFTSPHDSTVHLYDALLLADPDLAKLSCDELKAKSLQAIEAFQKSGALALRLADVAGQFKPTPAPLIQRCMTCHVGFEDFMAPRIPFDDLGKLKPMLAKSGYPRGRLIDEIIYRTSDHAPSLDQMPPSGQTSTQLRDELVQALLDLLNSK